MMDSPRPYLVCTSVHTHHGYCTVHDKMVNFAKSMVKSTSLKRPSRQIGFA